MEKAKFKLQQRLREAIAAQGAIKGTLQRYCKSTNELEIIVSEGFTQEFLNYFQKVKPFDSSCCGRSFGVGSVIIISDVEKDISFRPNLHVAREAGFKAVQSLPIFNAKSQKVGVLSVHFKEPKWLWNTSKLDGILEDISKIFDEHPVLTQDYI